MLKNNYGNTINNHEKYYEITIESDKLNFECVCFSVYCVKTVYLNTIDLI